MEIAEELGFVFTTDDYSDNHVHIQLSSDYSADNLTKDDKNVPNSKELSAPEKKKGVKNMDVAKQNDPPTKMQMFFNRVSQAINNAMNVPEVVK